MRNDKQKCAQKEKWHPCQSWELCVSRRVTDSCTAHSLWMCCSSRNFLAWIQTPWFARWPHLFLSGHGDEAERSADLRRMSAMTTSYIHLTSIGPVLRWNCWLLNSLLQHFNIKKRKKNGGGMQNMLFNGFLFSLCLYTLFCLSTYLFLSSSMQRARLYAIRQQRDKMVKEGTYTPPPSLSGQAD